MFEKFIESEGSISEEDQVSTNPDAVLNNDKDEEGTENISETLSDSLKEIKVSKPNSLSFPKSILPWSDNQSEFTESLLGAGYTSIQNIATASMGEIALLTIIPEDLIEKLLDTAKSWKQFNFNTAADLLLTRASFSRISTGSSAVDALLGGGIEPSGITEFYGAFTTGKTQLCIQLAVNTALPESLGGLDGDVIYIDTEGSFRPERIVQMCKGVQADPEQILNRIMVGRAHTTTMQMQLTNMLLEYAEDRNIKLVIIDSLTSNFRSEYIGKGAIMERQQKLNQHLQQISRIGDLLQAAIVVTNQVMAVMDVENNATQPIGGNILAHGSTHRIELSKSRRHPTHRHAKLIASPSLPEGKASFMILEAGLQDI